jgi:hypothetical protein
LGSVITAGRVGLDEPVAPSAVIDASTWCHRRGARYDFLKDAGEENTASLVEAIGIGSLA